MPTNRTAAPKPRVQHQPARHLLDRRAHHIAEQAFDSNPEALLDTPAVADWLGVSVQWLEIGRSKNYGPEFQRLGPKAIRYKRAAVIDWLKSRTYACTSEYMGGE